MVNVDYLYNPDAAKGAFDKNYFLDKKLGFQVIEHGMILPHKSFPGEWFGRGGIVDSQNNYIRESSVHIGIGASYTPPRINSTQLRDCNLSCNALSRLGALFNGQHSPTLVSEE